MFSLIFVNTPFFDEDKKWLDPNANDGFTFEYYSKRNAWKKCNYKFYNSTINSYTY